MSLTPIPYVNSIIKDAKQGISCVMNQAVRVQEHDLFSKEGYPITFYMHDDLSTPIKAQINPVMEQIRVESMLKIRPDMAYLWKARR